MEEQRPIHQKNAVTGNIEANNVDMGDKYYGMQPPDGKCPKELTVNIPKTNPDDIIGREADLEELHTLLNERKKVVVVNGLGGIGKTTLAQVYVEKYYNNYKHIAWVTQTPDGIVNDFINTDGLAKALKVEYVSIEAEQRFRDIILKLKAIEEAPNLLVIDNAVQSLSNYRHSLPGQPNWHVLVTSRELLEEFHTKKLDFLNEEQAIELFKKHYQLRRLSDEEIKELVRLVDYHTLTIEILAKMARVQRYEAGKLMHAIEQDLRAHIAVARQGEQVDKIGSYLNTVFNLSNLTEVELWMMKQFVCLPPEFHTYDLIRELLINEDSPNSEVFAETLSGLTQKGWLLYNTETDSYKIHRIIAEVTKTQHPLVTDDIVDFIFSISEKLYVDQTKDNPVEKFVWIPFGKSILMNFSDDESGKLTQLQGNLAWVLQEVGNYKEAKDLLETAVKSDEQNFGKDHPTTATRYSNLAIVLQDLGDYEEAKRLLQIAVKSGEITFGEDHPTTTTRYSNLAMVLRGLGEYEEAKRLLQIAVKSDEKNLGKDHPIMAIRYSNLAIVLQNLGEDEGAKKLLQIAVESDEKNFGKHHPTTATSYSNLSLVLQKLNKYEDALTFIEKAVAIFKKTLPEGHPYIATVNSNYESIKSDISNQNQ